MSLPVKEGTLFKVKRIPKSIENMCRGLIWVLVKWHQIGVDQQMLILFLAPSDCWVARSGWPSILGQGVSHNLAHSERAKVWVRDFCQLEHSSDQMREVSRKFSDRPTLDKRSVTARLNYKGATRV